MKNADILTKREYFAGLALQGILAGVNGDSNVHATSQDWVKDMVESSVEFAWHNLLREEEAIDAMMKATFVYGRGPLLYGQEVALRMIYAAVQDGKIPGIKLEKNYGN